MNILNFIIKNDSNIDEKFNKYCYSFFDTVHDPDDNRYLSEDYTFCRRWQKIGGEIWLDPNTKLNHIGVILLKVMSARLLIVVIQSLKYSNPTFQVEVVGYNAKM